MPESSERNIYIEFDENTVSARYIPPLPGHMLFDILPAQYVTTDVVLSGIDKSVIEIKVDATSFSTKSAELEEVSSLLEASVKELGYVKDDNPINRVMKIGKVAGRAQIAAIFEPPVAPEQLYEELPDYIVPLELKTDQTGDYLAIIFEPSDLGVDAKSQEFVLNHIADSLGYSAQAVKAA
jgi:hypothetical protein